MAEYQGNYCLICGYQSKQYTYCYICSQARELDKILFCKECNYYYLKHQECKCEVVVERSSLCVVCGTQSAGYWFCKSCYKKYSNKVVAIEFTNCTQSSVLEEGYKAKHFLKNGRNVRSTHEQLIGNMLIDLGIEFEYEKVIQTSANVKDDIKPDFYLVEHNAFLEHFGIEDKGRYAASKQFKLDKYKEMGLTIIYTQAKDLADLPNRLPRLIKFHEKNKINYLDDTGNVKQE
ncbi:MAG: hypothetical protein FWB72_01720 [Firmicutes bacterium]|nr:hypothetical protein [Bacillota bacterium]